MGSGKEREDLCIPGDGTSLAELIPAVASLAIPVALQNLLATTGSMVDTMMLATLGEKTVGAVGLCAQYSSLMFSGYWGFVGGGMLFFSQFFGAGDHDNICRTYGMTLSFMMISALAFGSLAVFRPHSVMSLYTASVPIREIGVRYLRIIGWSYPIQVVAMAMAALLRSVARVKIPLAGAVASVLANCFCNYVLIFGKFGFPAMGVEGAALGTIIANIVEVIVIGLCVLRGRVPYVFDFSLHFAWNGRLLREYLAKCFPILMNEVLIGVGNMLINIVLGHQADEAIAATAVFRTFEGMVIAFFSGFSSAATVLVGKEVGAGRHEIAFRRSYKIIGMTQVCVAAGYLLILLLHRPLLHAMSLQGLSYDYCARMLLIFFFVSIIRMGNWCTNDTFRAAGDSAFGSTMEIVFMFLLVQPVIHLASGPLRLPFLAVFALCYCDEPIRYVIMQVHLRSRKWIKPVSEAGKKTIAAYREKYHVRVRGGGA